MLLPASGADSIVPQNREPFEGTPYYDIDDYFDFIGRKQPPWEIERYRYNSEDPRHTRDGFNNGKSTTTVGANDNAGRAIIFQTDGSILVAGRADTDFGIVRLVPSGHLDTSFNSSGRNATDFSGGMDVAHSIALDADGRAVLAGRVYAAANSDFGVARYTTSGVLDTTFNSTGKVMLDINSSHDIARGVAVGTSGKVVVAGYSYNGSVYTFSVAQLTSDGKLDTTFSTSGKKTTLANANDNGALSVSITTAEQLVLAGNAHNGTNWDAAIVVYRSDGTTDTSFNTTGKTVFSVGSGDETLYSITVDTGGRIVGAGTAKGSADMDFLIVRLLSSGVFDTTFGQTGKIRATISGGDETAYSVKTQQNHSVAVGGVGYNGSNNDFAFLRFLSGGDRSAGVLTPVGSLDDFGMALHMEDDGTYYVAGRTNNGSALNFAVVRYDSTGTVAIQGMLDKSFNGVGSASVTFGGVLYPSAIKIDTSGRFLIGSDRAPFYRLKPDWTLDTSFASTGYATNLISGTVRSISEMNDGKIIVNISNGWGIARLLTNGLLDTTFNLAGYVSGYSGAGNAIVDLSGRITTARFESTSGAFLIRYLSNGQLDTTFSSNGLSRFFTGSGNSSNIFLASNGDLYGYTKKDNVNLTYSFALARILSNGNLDTTFSTNGIFEYRLGEGGTEIRNIRDVGGKLQIITSRDMFSVGNLAILRLNSSGQFDTSFYDKGWNFLASNLGVSGMKSAVLLRGGRVNIGAQIYLSNAVGFRILDDGTLDTTFGTAGVAMQTQFNRAPLMMWEDTRGRVIHFGYEEEGIGTNNLVIYRIYP